MRGEPSNIGTLKFLIHLAKNVRIGDTIDVSINKKPARVTWRDAETLVIEPDDA